MIKKVKLNVEGQTWLVPIEAYSDQFISAFNKMTEAKHGQAFEWTDEEEEAFNKVSYHIELKIF